jgi:hypothetical protein
MALTSVTLEFMSSFHAEVASTRPYVDPVITAPNSLLADRVHASLARLQERQQQHMQQQQQ